MTDTKVFSPNQIAFATFLGGPLAATKMLRNNFKAAGDRGVAGKILLAGWLFTFVLIGILPFLPKYFNIVILIAYTVAARQAAERYKDKFAGEKYENGKAVFVTLQSFIIFMVLSVPYLLVLYFLGYTAAN